jgi:hypothetical protein
MPSMHRIERTFGRGPCTFLSWNSPLPTLVPVMISPVVSTFGTSLHRVKPIFIYALFRAKSLVVGGFWPTKFFFACATPNTVGTCFPAVGDLVPNDTTETLSGVHARETYSHGCSTGMEERYTRDYPAELAGN